MADILNLLKKGALSLKQEHYQSLLLKVNHLTESIRIGLFRYRDNDLDDINDAQVLLAAQELVKVLAEARQLQKELE